jgi:hypothetical protein
MIESAQSNIEKINGFLEEYHKRLVGDVMDQEIINKFEDTAKAGEIYSAPRDVIRDMLDGHQDGFVHHRDIDGFPKEIVPVKKLIDNGIIINYVISPENIPFATNNLDKYLTLVSRDLINSLEPTPLQ